MRVTAARKCVTVLERRCLDPWDTLPRAGMAGAGCAAEPWLPPRHLTGFLLEGIMASKAKKADAPKAAAASPAGVKASQKPRGRVVKGRPSRGSGVPVVQRAVVVGHVTPHRLDPIADDFVDIHRIAAKQPHLGLPALASALEAAFRRMAARLGKK